MVPLFIKTISLSLLVIGVSACNSVKEKVITKWPGGEKQVTYKIYSGDEHTLTNVYYCGYYPNGQIWKSGYFKDGKESGEWFYYYQSGKMKGKGTFYNGMRSDAYEVYYESGQLEQRGSYDLKTSKPVVVMYKKNGSIKTGREDFSKYFKETPVA